MIVIGVNLMKELRSNEPLLYVTQPELERPESKMQSEYLSGEDKKEPITREEKNKTETSFKNLSIEEKINYLTDLPEDLFQMRCKFTTKKKTYFGSITAHDEAWIQITHSGRQKVTVPIDELEQIQLIGL